jgi:putative addiction module antidote
MNVTVRKIGNSEGIILPKELLSRYGLKSGDDLTIIEQNGSFTLKAAEKDFDEQMEYAREFMDQYKVALQKLAE